MPTQLNLNINLENIMEPIEQLGLAIFIVAFFCLSAALETVTHTPIYFSIYGYCGGAIAMKIASFR